MKIQYISRKFTAGSLALIETVNAIIAEYQAQGFDLTLRQIADNYRTIKHFLRENS